MCRVLVPNSLQVVFPRSKPFCFTSLLLPWSSVSSIAPPAIIKVKLGHRCHGRLHFCATWVYLAAFALKCLVSGNRYTTKLTTTTENPISPKKINTKKISNIDAFCNIINPSIDFLLPLNPHWGNLTNYKVKFNWQKKAKEGLWHYPTYEYYNYEYK